MRTSSPSSLFSLALAASVLLVVSPGLGDVVMPPPQDCAPGSTGRSSHQGPHCVPTKCSTDADCQGLGSWRDEPRKASCRDRVALCIEQRDFTSRRWPGDAGKNMQPVAVGACDAAGACASPAVCELARRCVFEDAPAQAPVPTGAPEKGPDVTPPASPGPDSTPPASPGPVGASPKEPSKTGCTCRFGDASEPAGAGWLAFVGLGLLAVRRGRGRRLRRTDY